MTRNAPNTKGGPGTSWNQEKNIVKKSFIELFFFYVCFEIHNILLHKYWVDTLTTLMLHFA